MLVVFISLLYMRQNIPRILQTLLLSDEGSKQTIVSQIIMAIGTKVEPKSMSHEELGIS